jgi:hypothetical protein
MFIPRIVGHDGKLVNRAEKVEPSITDQLTEIMAVLGAVPIGDPLPERPRPPRPRLAMVYTCPSCTEQLPAMTVTTCDLCLEQDLPCHHNPNDGYVCVACASDKGICRGCGCPKPIRRSHR